VWLTEGASEEEVRVTALKRYRDRIAEPIELSAEGTDGNWRFQRSGPAKGGCEGSGYSHGRAAVEEGQRQGEHK
jgi:hypothetical protein